MAYPKTQQNNYYRTDKLDLISMQCNLELFPSNESENPGHISMNNNL